jgi:hypothetical protein
MGSTGGYVNVTEKQLYCKYCSVPVKAIYRGPDFDTIGRGRLPTHVHITSRDERDPIQCKRINLYEDDVTEENKWG